MGFHRYVMVWLYFKHKDRKAVPAPLPAELPRVTIQLPIFNEMYVIDRLLESVAAVRYPKDRLEIQLLDDSTDETTAIASRAVEHYREQGFDIHYLHRADRTGYKAGALDAGLRTATGEFVLIFDADFVAPPTSWRRPWATSPTRRSAWSRRAGATSTATSRCSRRCSRSCSTGTSSWSTGAEPLGALLQLQRHRRVWRRSVIADAGGWQHDTLTEDLDLSYRAQMKAGGSSTCPTSSARPSCRSR